MWSFRITEGERRELAIDDPLDIASNAQRSINS